MDDGVQLRYELADPVLQASSKSALRVGFGEQATKRCRFHFPTSYPASQDLMMTIVLNLDTAWLRTARDGDRAKNRSTSTTKGITSLKRKAIRPDMQRRFRS